MATDIAGLFTTPEQYQQNQLAQFQNRAAQEVQFSPFQQAALGARTAGYQLGQGIGGALGGQDPQLQLIARRQQLASQLDQSDPNSFMKVAQLAAQSGDPQFAMAVADAGRQLQISSATARKTTAEAQKAELSLTQEAQLRDELSKLPPDAKDEDILKVVTKYGSPDKVLSALQVSSDKAAQREMLTSQAREKLDQQKELKLAEIENKKELALQRASDEKEREKIRAEAKVEAANVMAEGRRQLALLASSLKQPPAPSITQIVDPTNPNQMLSIDARLYKGGGIGSVGVIGIGGKEPTAAVRQQKVEQGKTELTDAIDTLKASFDKLNDMNAIVSEKRSPLSNVLSSVQGSAVGQFGGKTFGTKAQEERNVINATKSRLVNAIKNATGMSAQQLNSNLELRTMLDSLSDVSLGYEASMRILDNLENMYVKGQGNKPQKSQSTPSTVAPSGQTSKGTKYQVLPD